MVGDQTAPWHWTHNEHGFKNYSVVRTYLRDKVSEATEYVKANGGRQLKLAIVDCVFPDEFINQDTQVCLTNSLVKPGVIDTAYYESLPPSWYGSYAGEIPVVDTQPTKAYNCFINRVDPIRQSWFYLLSRQGIFNQGYISFNLFQTAKAQEMHGYTTAQEIYEVNFNKCLHNFEVEHLALKSLIPYKNFNPEIQISEVIMDTKFSLVLETGYTSNGGVITFSEKIFRCLKLPRPWIAYTMPGAIAYLKQLGFDVVDDLVDHSYDNIEHDIERQTAVLNLAVEMCNFNLSDKNLQRLKEAVKHNCKLLDTLNQTVLNDIATSVNNVIKKSMTNVNKI